MDASQKIDKQNVEDLLGLTPMQEGLLFHFLKDPEGSMYVEQLCLMTGEAIDEEWFAKAWQHVTDRHEMLRTVFRWEKVKKPVQVVLKQHGVNLRVADASGSEQVADAVLEELKQRDRAETFTLLDVPFRVTLCRLPQGRSAVLITNHHILFDGWSTGIVLRDFLTAYRCLSEGKTLPNVPKARYKQYVQWLLGRDAKREAEFWKEALAGYEVTPMPGTAEVASADWQIKTLVSRLPESFGVRLQKAAGEQKVTLAALLYTAWGLVLQTYAGREDVLFGTTVSGRETEIAGLEETVGLFIHTPPLRVSAPGGATLGDAARQVHERLLARKEFETTSLVRIREQADAGQRDLFDSIVVIENYPLDSMLTDPSGGLSFDGYSMFEQTNFDLTLSVSLLEDVELTFAYNRAKFTPQDMERLSAHLAKALEALTSRPEMRVGELELVTAEEHEQTVVAYNDTAADYPKQRTVVELFEEQVRKTPERMALACGSQSLTYRELNERVNQLARTLREGGVGPEDRVTVMTERSLEMVVAVLAVLKAGGAYVPVDSEYPDERIAYLIGDSGAKWHLADETGAAKLAGLQAGGEVLRLDQASLYASDGSDLPLVSGPSNLAYMIYTSGTTGRPKGVLIEHQGLTNYLVWAAKMYVRGEEVHFPLYTSLSFDLTVTSVFTPLITGNAVIVYPGEQRELLVEQILDDNRVGVMKLTPSHLKLIRDKKMPASSLKRFILGGEDLEADLSAQIIANFDGKLEILNEYGPTETVVGCMIHSFDPETDRRRSVPIGMPGDNVQIYVLDAYLKPVPVGVAGEMYISGDGVARGYWNRDDLTAEKFVPNPFRPGTRMYRTGDLARFLPNGLMEYMGRIDEQIKIRGHRVETLEIEAHLMKREEIEEAVVILRRDPGREPALCAYYVSADGQELSVSLLRNHLESELPSHMIPAFFVQVDKIPLTTNGKVNKAALPAPTVSRQALETAFVSAESELEQALVGIWQEVLGLEQVGVEDKYFEIGGNSLNIIQLRNKIKEQLGEEVPITALFQHPTVRSQATYLTRGEEEETPVFEPMERSHDSAGSGDIAVVGLAGRFPGAKNVNEFWQNLQNGVESVAFFSDEELLEAGVDPELMRQPNYVKAKAILDDVRSFDPEFFGYSPRQAELMDPQIRLLHEAAYHALEDAGYDSERYAGRIGMYVGSTSNFHWVKRLAARANDNLSEMFELGALNDTFTVSTRLSYKLNLKGPSISLQTACSTSLVATHLACQAIMNGECEMALAGGVSILLPEKAGYLYQPGMVKSPDGHCRAFDAKAEGTIGGDGVGFVVLKRLDEALRDGDEVYAVIKGSAINNDGSRKVAFTAPSVDGQVEVVQAALASAGVDPESITYVETHGAGTTLGDPIEIEALKQAYRTKKRGYCRIGSVKTNIGHLDAAAGVAGLIKTVLALKHKQIPPSLHYTAPNPAIDFENSPFFVNTALTPWETEQGPRRAGVSSLGMGGTNAHVILEEAPAAESEATSATSQEREWNLFTLSARTETALAQMTANLSAHLEAHPDLPLRDAAYTLQVGRRPFAYRRTVVARDAEGLLAALSREGVQPKEAAGEGERRVVFLFSGQGAQYVNMGRGLYDGEPTFRAEMDRGFDAYRRVTGEDLKPVLYPEPGAEAAAAEALRQTQAIQPAIFLLETALGRLLMQWGIRPQAMIGYSFGEYAAACMAGVFTVEDALRLIAARGDLMGKTPTGALVSVPLTAEQVRPLLTEGVVIAIDNGPSCIVAGAAADIDAFEAQMKAHKQLCMRVKGTLAAHSPLLECVADEFLAEVRKTEMKAPQIPYISNVTGTWVTAEEATDPAYWVRHMMATVRFAEGVEELMQEPNTVFVELGPGQDLAVLLQRSLDKERGQEALALIRTAPKKVHDVEHLLAGVGKLWAGGVTINWQRFHENEACRRVALPGYPFERKQYWVDDVPLTAQAAPSRTARAQEGKRPDIADWFYLPTWRKTLPPPVHVDPIQDGETQDMPTWLFFLDETGFGEQLAARIEQEALGQVVRVRSGGKWEALSEGLFTLNPRHADEYARLISELERLDRLPDRIVHLWNLGDPPSDATDSIWRADVQELGFYSMLHLVHAIRKQGLTKALDWRIITNGMQAVAGETALYPEKATVLSPTLVLPQEFRNIRTQSIDVTLPTAGSWQEARLLEQVLTELQAGDLGQWVAYRDNDRFTKTYEPTRVEQREANLREKGVYLITGGLGYIGLVLAEHLARRVQARLVLTGRSPFPSREQWDGWVAANGEDHAVSRKIRHLQAIEQLGAEVRVVQADVVDRERMQAAVETAEREFGALHGVIHAAGVTGDLSFRAIDQTDREFCELHFAPKMHGLAVLEEVLEGRTLDFCVLTSSLSPILGGLGFYAYAAANLYLDAHVQRHNRTQPTPWLALNFDGWQLETGQENVTGVGASMMDLLIAPEEGKDVFERALSLGPVGQVIASTGDLGLRLAKWVTFEGRDDAADNRPSDKRYERPALSTDYVAPQNEIEEKLAEIWQGLFGIDKLGVQDDFFELGGDSLKAITVVSAIHKELHVEVALPDFFEMPTMEQLAAYIAGAEKSDYLTIDPAPGQDYYELSSAQKRLYLMQQMEPGHTGYNEITVGYLAGDLDRERFEKTMRALIERHESLRTSFVVVDGVPMQKIHRAEDIVFEIEYMDATSENAEKMRERAHAMIRDFTQPFALDQAPLMRAGLIRLGDEGHALLLDMHHIVSDGLSQDIFVYDFMAIYDGQDLPPLRLQYKDFSYWQNRKTGENAHASYWIEQLADAPTLNLPYDHPRPPMKSFAGGRIRFELGAEETARLKQMVLSEEVTLFMALLAIYNVLLAKLSGQEDFVVGVPIAGRNHQDLQPIIGIFVNMLAMRNRPAGDLTFREFLHDLGANTLQAFKHQDCQFEELVGQLSLPRDLSRHQVFDVAFALQNMDTPVLEIAGLQLQAYDYEHPVSRFDLLLMASESDDKMAFLMEYSDKLFREETVRRFIRYWHEILEQILDNPDLLLKDIRLTSELVEPQGGLLLEDDDDFDF